MGTNKKTEEAIFVGIGCGFVLLVVGFIISAIVYHVNTPIIKTSEERLNIVRVFIHNPNEYSVLIQDKEKLISRDFYRSCNKAELLTDASEGEPMYVEIFYFKRQGEDSIHHEEAKIHIHSVSEVEGGGWNRREGKRHVTGQTNVVE